MGSTKDLFINMSISIVAILCLLAVESMLAAGIIPRGVPVDKICEGPNDRGVFHPVYGWTARPNHTYLRKQEGASEYVLHKYNSEGFRDFYNSGDRNIIVLGDSYTQGSLASNNETFPFLLDIWAPNTSFLNYGVGGYGTAQQLLLYQEKGREIEHNLTILGYYLGNDARNNVDSLPTRPQFKINQKGGLIQAHEPKRDTRDNKNSSRDHGLISISILQRIQDFLNKNTFTYTFVRKRIYRLIKGSNSSVKTPPKGEELKEQIKLTRKLLKELSLNAKNNSADLLVVMIPERGEINIDNPHHYTYSKGRYYWEKQRKMVNTLAENTSNMEVLDLKPALEQHFNSGKRVYGRIDGHLNSQGYRIAAKSIYTHLIREEYIENTTARLSKEYGQKPPSCPT